MEGRNLKLRGVIYGQYISEAEFARRLGWTRQRLNAITTGQREPNLAEAKEMADALNMSFEELAYIFLPTESTKR